MPARALFEVDERTYWLDSVLSISAKDRVRTCDFLEGAGLWDRDPTSSSSAKPVLVRLIGLDFFDLGATASAAAGESEKPWTSASAKQSAAACRTWAAGESMALNTDVSSLSKSDELRK